MKKLTLNELMDIADEITEEVYRDSNKDTKIQKTMSGAILSVVALFMDRYQKKVFESD